MIKSVEKRDGRVVLFDSDKIATAILKALEAASEGDARDAALLADSVQKELEKQCSDRPPKIEEIQDIVEKELIKSGFILTAKKYIIYRAERTKVREMNTALMKIFDELTNVAAGDSDMKRDNANIDGDTAMGTMLKYGSEAAKDYYEKYLLTPQQAEAHRNGDIHIHDFDFYALTTTCCQIQLSKLFKGGFSTGHGFLREPNDIQSYSALACIAIQSNQNDQHGGQSIVDFDYGLAPGVKKTYKKNYISNLYKALEILYPCQEPDTTPDKSNGIKGGITLGDLKEVESHIESIDSVYPRIETDDRYLQQEKAILLEKGIPEDIINQAQKFAVKEAYRETEKATYQAMEALIHNLNTMHSRAGAQTPFSSINYGMDTSPEGRMVVRNILLATDAGLGMGETPIFPIQIFRVKEGINYNPGEPNYDLFQLSCKVSAKRLFPNFSFIDSPFNLQYYKPGHPETEIAYMGCRTRVMGNVFDPDQEIAPGRGNLSFTSINLPRLGIKHGIVSGETDLDGFFKELEELMDLVKDQLLERFEIQCSKRIYNFPFLLGQGVWIDSEKLKPNDRLRKVLKHGTLTIGFIGLAECLKALIGKHHGESEEAQKLGLKIIGFMRNKIDEYAKEYNLNFSLIATPAEGLSGRFTNIDKAIYGKIKGVTDREYYTNSFHVPVYYNISAVKKIQIEAPYHAFTNGGHITYVELDGDTAMNVDAFEKIIRVMHDNGIGYGAINHPVDRDPVCGYTGVIGDFCPGCGRKEGEGVPMERIKNSSLNTCGGR